MKRRRDGYQWVSVEEATRFLYYRNTSGCAHASGGRRLRLVKGSLDKRLEPEAEKDDRAIDPEEEEERRTVFIKR